jgi:hypothetical protein
MALEPCRIAEPHRTSVVFVARIHCLLFWALSFFTASRSRFRPMHSQRIQRFAGKFALQKNLEHSRCSTHFRTLLKAFKSWCTTCLRARSVVKSQRSEPVTCDCSPLDVRSASCTPFLVHLSRVQTLHVCQFQPAPARMTPACHLERIDRYRGESSFACTHTCTHKCTQLHTTAHKCTQMHKCTNAQMHTNAHKCTQMHTNAHTNAQMHKCTHKCTNAQMHARTLRSCRRITSATFACYSITSVFDGGGSLLRTRRSNMLTSEQTQHRPATADARALQSSWPVARGEQPVRLSGPLRTLPKPL